MPKNDLAFRSPRMNAAGMLGFTPDVHSLIRTFPTEPRGDLGAFVTNPISLRPRKPSPEALLLPYPGGALLHTGLPNPGFSSAMQKYARRWATIQMPVIVHLMVDQPDETARMVRRLEGLENIAGVELGFAPQEEPEVILMTVEMSVGELPLIANLPLGQVLGLGTRVIQRGAAAISFAAPRGELPRMVSVQDEALQLTRGRLYGPGLFPQSLSTLRSATKMRLPIIAGVGVYKQEQADIMLDCGALAVQLDTILWL